MLFTVDIGNTNIVIAIHDEEKWVNIWRVSTEKKKTTDEYYLTIIDLLNYSSVNLNQIKKCIVSSVVPSLSFAIEKAIFRIFKIKPIMVNSKLDTGLDKDSIPSEIGSDILSNLVFAHDKYPNDTCTVLDFGTALTCSSVSPEGKILGVAITPGLITSMKALVNNTAQLPEIELREPESVLGMDTPSSIRAGIMFGFAGLANELVRRTEEELGVKVKVLVTGGLSSTISKMLHNIDYLDKNLTLNGIKLIASKN
ncbi:MAG: type III pantothenate kinase [Sphaerochaetaceae bacterium]|nr:type III pantothenate kinase [Sphaerochaetaceae bacterium]